MNLCVLAGRIVRKASVKGTDRKILLVLVQNNGGIERGRLLDGVFHREI